MDLLQVVITFNPQTGTLSVSAPKDKIVAYGLIEWAKEQIGKRKEEESNVIRPSVAVGVAADIVGRG